MNQEMIETTVFGDEERTFQPLFDSDPVVIAQHLIDQMNGKIKEKPIELPDEWFEIDI